MAYVEWHEQIRNHYKTEALMKALRIKRREAIGILGMLVSWTIGHRPGGIIERNLIGIAVEWEGSNEELVKALNQAGWVDTINPEEVKVHDWEDVTRGYRKVKQDTEKRTLKRRAKKAEEEESLRSERAVTAQSLRVSSAVTARTRPDPMLADSHSTPQPPLQGGLPPPAPPKGGEGADAATAAPLPPAPASHFKRRRPQKPDSEKPLYVLAMEARITAAGRAQYRSYIDAWTASAGEGRVRELFVAMRDNPGKPVYDIIEVGRKYFSGSLKKLTLVKPTSPKVKENRCSDPAHGKTEEYYDDWGKLQSRMIGCKTCGIGLRRAVE